MSRVQEPAAASSSAPPPEPSVDLDLAREHGLTAEEFELLHEILGREPNFTELGITSALWSEHCSYKSSKAYLREFPTAGPHVIHGPGENAGVVDLGFGWVAAFKMESHNHPSYIEPYQGAATGVGGILRDVFTMGALAGRGREELVDRVGPGCWAGLPVWRPVAPPPPLRPGGASLAAPRGDARVPLRVSPQGRSQVRSAMKCLRYSVAPAKRSPPHT
jgi:hypothetical protein